MSVDGAARISRRRLLGAGIGGAAAVALGASFLPDLLGGSDKPVASRAPARVGGRTRDPHGYGPLGRPGEHGIALPEGFEARLLARSGERVPGTSYVFHTAPDGAATFPVTDGGWIYASNSEVPGGVGAIRFNADGSIADAYPILKGTQYNCSGGATPWGTWLSCEEVPTGQVWECDPTGRHKAVARPAMGVFFHEAVAVGPAGRRIYMNEDKSDGGLYRFTPRRWGKLDSGLLEIATVSHGRVSWTRVPDPSGHSKPTRQQVAMTPFLRSEGLTRIGRTLYIGTTLDSVLYAYDLRTGRIERVYEAAASKHPPLTMIDQMTASPAGELFIAEDNEKPEFSIGVLDPPRSVTRFLTVSGPEHHGSELSGVAFNPAGTRFYFSSQRAFGNGAVYEVTGPFRRRL
ncbi:MAG TPA: alkaline phosphatase PhoX [Solirubrobacteraceae bacterium]